MQRAELVIVLALALCSFACNGSNSPSGSLAGSLLGGHEVEAAGLKLEVPSAWRPLPPRQSGLVKRAAQMEIPGAAGFAEVAVFHFGEGRGGKVEANLTRWAAQVEMEEGGEAEREYFEEGSFAITMLSAKGTLRASRFGMGPSVDRPESMLIAAVVEGPGGPWFFKATGPTATLEPQRQLFTTMLKSARLD